MITVSLCVKYRAFGVTFGFNERGVTLKVVYTQ